MYIFASCTLEGKIGLNFFIEHYVAPTYVNIMKQMAQITSTSYPDPSLGQSADLQKAAALAIKWSDQRSPMHLTQSLVVRWLDEHLA